MQQGLYVIAGETFDEQDVVAGLRISKKLKRRLRKLKKVASKAIMPALGVASIAMPALAPAAAAAAMASRLSTAAKQGKKPARAAMRLMGKSADRGDQDAQRFMAILQRVSQATPPQAAPRTLLNAAQIRELAQRARQGNKRARRVLQHVAGMADRGDPSAQSLLEHAAGTTRWDHPHHRGQSPLALPADTPADIVAGGPFWDFFKPRRVVRDESESWGPRDAYRLGILAAPPR